MKSSIGFHRSYRRLVIDGKMRVTALCGLLLALSFFFLKWTYGTAYTYNLSVFLWQAFAKYINVFAPIGRGELGAFAFYYVDVQPAVPPPATAAAVAAACAGIIFISRWIKIISPPIRIFVNLNLALACGFSLLFLLIPQEFKPKALPIGEMLAQVSVIIWMTLPFLFWLILVPVPGSFFGKIFIQILFELVLVPLLAVKSWVFMMLCGTGTFLVVPAIITFLCSLVDVIYMVSIFSVYLSHVSTHLSKQSRLWLWA